MLAYNKNSNGRYEIVEQEIQWHGEIPEITESFFVAQVDSEVEAVFLIQTIQRWEDRKKLEEEVECNSEWVLLDD